MTEEKHTGLPVSGYKPQSAEKVALVNGFKADEERLLRQIDSLRPQKFAALGENGMAVAVGGPAEFDQRWLSIARTHIEQGYMALNRAVFQPGRVTLPDMPTE